MNCNPHRASAVLLAALAVLLAVSPARPQRGKRGAPAASPSRPAPAGPAQPQLWITHGEEAEVQGEPAIRFPVYHSHGLAWCSGYLLITETRVGYEVTNGPRDYSQDSFLRDRGDATLQVTDDKQFRLQLKGGREYRYKVVRDPLDPWGSSLENVSTRPLQEAWENFDVALERARTASGASRPAPAPAPPEILLLEPRDGEEIQAEAVTVRGVVVSEKTVTLVRVGKSIAAMQPRSERAMEFWLENVSLQPGENRLELAARDVDGREASLALTVKRVEAPPKPSAGLALDDLLKLLEAGVTPARLEAIVKDRGVRFALTEDAEKKLRAAGATSELLLAIAKAKK